MSDEKDTAIIVTPEIAEAATGNLAVLPSISDIKAMVERARFMGEKLDELRTIAVQRTLASDWVKMGDTCYLEGDGGLRLAPIIGLRITNVRKETRESSPGIYTVTMLCDAESQLFGTRFENIERSRRTDDGFLKRGGTQADLEDVISSCHKGLIARAAQLCAGLSGLTPEELRDRYGMGVKSEVKFQTGASQAKAEDKAKAASGLAEIHRILRKLSGGDEEIAADMLQELTKNPEKGWAGKRRPENLTEVGVTFVLRALKEREAAFDAHPQPDLNLGGTKK